MWLFVRWLHTLYRYVFYIVLIKQTLVWPSAGTGLTVFKVSAINSCGGQATACFFVSTCKTCT